MTVVKPVRESHSERTIDGARLSRSLKPQLIFMISFSKTTREVEVKKLCGVQLTVLSTRLLLSRLNAVY